MQEANSNVMKYIPMNDNADWDVDMRLAEVQIAKQDVHSHKELPSVNLLNRILSTTIEMKSHVQTLKTGNLYIEFQQDTYGNRIMKPSGLYKTKADMWFFNIGEMGLFLSTAFFIWLMTCYQDFGLVVKDNVKTGKDNLTDGLIIPMPMVMDLYLAYEKHLQKIEKEDALKRVRAKLYPPKT